MVNRVEGALVPGGYVALTGWAADFEGGAPVAKIEILLDETTPGEGVLSGLRPDVLSHFARADFLWSGWNATVSLEGSHPGKHRVSVAAVSHSGKRALCTEQAIEVLPFPKPRKPPPWILGLRLLLWTGGCVSWLAFAGWAAARLLGAGFAGLRAPLLGLALFAIFVEGGAAVGLRPFSAAALLTLVSAAALAVSFRIRPIRFRRPAPTSVVTLAIATLFAAIASVPLAAHGEGAVLGDIDDGVRAAAVADSINLHGWSLPPEAGGYLAKMRKWMFGTGGRRGEYYILAALSKASGTRAHAIYPVAMLSAGFLAICATALLATRVLRRKIWARWLAILLVAANSVLFATVFGQHLGNLLAVCLFVSFLSCSFVLLRSRRTHAVLPVGLTIAAAWTLYPETLALWAAAALLSLCLVSGIRRRRAVLRYSLALLFGLLINPIGAVRTARFLRTASQAAEFSSPYQRLITGDTHYFPSVNVVTGLEAYRDDAPAPAGPVRSFLIPVASITILMVALTGWIRLSRREGFLVLALLAPPALALFVNFRLNFPYGYAKFLALAVPVWSVAFLFLVSRLAEPKPAERGLRRTLLAFLSVFLVFLLSLPSARHVFRRARRAVPAYDPAFQALPALAKIADKNAILCTQTPSGARIDWLLYFLGENDVEFASEGSCPSGPRYFFLKDRRQAGAGSASGIAATLYFTLIPTAVQGPSS